MKFDEISCETETEILLCRALGLISTIPGFTSRTPDEILKSLELGHL